MSASTPSRRGEVLAGVREIFPLIVGAIPFGIIFGAMAVTGGLSPVAAAGMSAIVFAGSSQFVAVGMLAGGASLGVIVLTTFIVNLRHMLYAATLVPHMRYLHQRWLLPLGVTLTDESFFVAVRRFQRPDKSPFKHWFLAGASAAMYINWQFFTWVGIWAGRSIPNPQSWGLDFAFPVTFLGMLIPQVRSIPAAVCVIAAGITALVLQGLPNKLGLMAAALVGVAAGMAAERLAPGKHAPFTREVRHDSA